MNTVSGSIGRNKFEHTALSSFLPGAQISGSAIALQTKQKNKHCHKMRTKQGQQILDDETHATGTRASLLVDTSLIWDVLDLTEESGAEEK